MHNSPPADLITWAQETLKSLNYLRFFPVTTKVPS